jgi:hypothetical protein
MHQDGSDRRKITVNPVVQMQTISPDGQWVVAQVAYPNEDPPRGIAAIPVSGGGWVRLCQSVCSVRWSLDGKAIFLSLPGASRSAGLNWGTIVVSLPAGKMFPKLPPLGIGSESEATALPNAYKVYGFAMPGIDEHTYAFWRASVHRNLFRIPLH